MFRAHAILALDGRESPDATDTTADTSPAQTNAAPASDALERDEFALMRLYVVDKSAKKFDRLYRTYEETGHVIG